MEDGDSIFRQFKVLVVHWILNVCSCDDCFHLKVSSLPYIKLSKISLMAHNYIAAANRQATKLNST